MDHEFMFILDRQYCLRVDTFTYLHNRQNKIPEIITIVKMSFLCRDVHNPSTINIVKRETDKRLYQP